MGEKVRKILLKSPRHNVISSPQFKRGEKSHFIKTGFLSFLWTLLRNDKTLPASIFLLFSVLSGCIRLAGRAGYWHQSADDEAPASKQVGFDTQDWVDPNRTKGSITV